MERQYIREVELQPWFAPVDLEADPLQILMRAESIAERSGWDRSFVLNAMLTIVNQTQSR